VSQYIAQWKDGFKVVWRNLTKAEYRSFKAAYDASPFVEPMDVALDIYEAVLEDGPDPKLVPAGIPAYICKQQMLNNPYSGLYEDIAPAVELARRRVTGDYLLASSAIIASTLNYKIEEIEGWDPTTFFIRLAQAEIATGRTFDPVDPKAPKDAQGNPIQKKQKRPLSPIQQKAVDRTRSRDNV
jgi:hypothetical protein